MALNPFFNVPRATLEGWLDDARYELASGKTISYWQGSDMAASQHVWTGMDPQKRIELIYRELSRIAPDEFPAAQLTRITVVQGRFKDSPY